MASSVGLNMAKYVSGTPHCTSSLGDMPTLVPPTWNKGEFHKQLANVWGLAAQVMATAENVFVIGYSLPETDAFFKYLFALGAMGDTRIKRFWVINPDPDGSVKDRFGAFLGRGIERRVKFIDGEAGQWENSIRLIHDALLASDGVAT